MFDLVHLSIYILALLVIILAIWAIYTHNRLHALLRGRKAADLEEIITDVAEGMEILHTKQETIMSELGHLDKRVKRSIQGVEVIRFNPFADAGSNQSFAISLINEKGDGVVLSSLYARDRMSIFAKPIKTLGSEFDLTDEEASVIKNAHERLSL